MKAPTANGTGRFARMMSAGYSLAEVLVASALIGLAMGGAVSLSATMNMQNDTARTVATTMSLQDCAARLWQLGMSSGEVDGIMPQPTNNVRVADAVVSSGSNVVTWSAVNPITLSNGMGTVEEIDNTITIRNPAGATDRANTLQVYRPTIR